MNRDPRFAFSQELEAKQTLLDQLRALATDDPDFFTDIIEGETNLLELAALDASIVDDETLVDGVKTALEKLQTRKRAAENRIELAGSSPIPYSKSVSRPYALRPPLSPSQTRASRPSLSPPKISRRAGGSHSRPNSIKTASPRQSARARRRSRRSGRGAPARRVTLGGVGKMAPEQARAAAKKVLGSAAHGKDPAADKTYERRSLPLEYVIEAFLAEHAEAKRKASTAAWYRGGLERTVKPALGGMNPCKVTRQDIARLHSSLRETLVQANRVLAIIGALYGFAAKAGYVHEDYNPARGIEKFPEQSRELFLTGDPGRLGKTIKARATPSITSGPTSSSTKARARSIPVVIPPDV